MDLDPTEVPEQEDPLERLKRRKAESAQQQQAPAGDDPLARLKAKRIAAPDTTTVAPQTPAQPAPKPKAPDLRKLSTMSMGKDLYGLHPQGVSPFTHVKSTLQVIPGMHTAEAGYEYAKSKLGKNPLNSLEEAKQKLDAEVGQLPEPLRQGEQILAGGELLKAIPFLRSLSPAKTGAAIGGAQQALEYRKDQSPLGYAGRVAAGTVGGYGLGKLLDLGGTGLRTLGAKTPDVNIIARQAARAKAAGDLYAAAELEGKTNLATPQVEAYLKEPDIARRVRDLRRLDEFKNIPPDSPEMLDPLYKSFSDEAGSLTKGLQATTPTKINQGRFNLRDIKGKQQSLLQAVSTPGPTFAGHTQPPTMPTYPEAVETYAQHSRGIRGVLKGVEAAQGPTRPTPEQLKSENPVTPAKYSKYLSKVAPEEQQAASEGILGDLKNAYNSPGFRQKIHQTSKAGGLLRRTQTPEEELANLFQRYGLTGAATKSEP